MQSRCLFFPTVEATKYYLFAWTGKYELGTQLLRVSLFYEPLQSLFQLWPDDQTVVDDTF